MNIEKLNLNEQKKEYEKCLFVLSNILNIPKNYKVLLFPGSCSGAMEAVIWSFLGNKTVTALIFDYWGVSWYEDLLKLNLKVDLRKNLEGDLPDLNNIPKNNDKLNICQVSLSGNIPIIIQNLQKMKSH